MNLVWFLTIGTIFSIILGEFGQFPFGVTSSSFSLTDVLLFLALLFLLIWHIGIKRDLKFLGPVKILSIFWGVGLASLIVSGNFSGGLYLLRFILYSSSLLLGYQLAAEGKRILMTILSAVVILLGIGFTQMIVFPDMSLLTDFGFDPHKNRMFSTILDPNFLGMILNVGFILSIYLNLKCKERRWLIFAVAFCTGIFLTFSRSAYLTLLAEVLILGIFRMRKLLLIAIVVFILLFTLIPRFNYRVTGGLSIDRTASERIESWKKGLIIFQESPIFGVGFNNIRSNLESKNLLKTYSLDGGNSGGGVDSSLIFVLATTGLLGFSSYIFFWWDIIKRLPNQKLIPLTIIAGLLINSQFINSLFFPPIMLVCFLTLGAFLVKEDGLELTNN